MKNNPYFSIVDAEQPNAKADHSEILSGSYWGIKKINHQYILNFISGSHGGETINIVISDTEFNKLKSGKIGIEELLKSHGTG
jgi:hypothetical protein